MHGMPSYIETTAPSHRLQTSPPTFARSLTLLPQEGQAVGHIAQRPCGYWCGLNCRLKSSQSASGRRACRSGRERAGEVAGLQQQAGGRGAVRRELQLLHHCLVLLLLLLWLLRWR